MHKSLLIASAVVAGVATAASVQYFWPAPGQPPLAHAEPVRRIDPAIDALDKCIRARFEKMPEMPEMNVGMSRVLRIVPDHLPLVGSNQLAAAKDPRTSAVPEYLPQFQPTTDDEIAAVAELKNQGLEVALQVGGRQLLKSGMSKTEWEQSSGRHQRHTFGEVIMITTTQVGSDLPQPWEIWERGRQVLTSPDSTLKVTTVRDWLVDMRPLIAYQQGCLKCHGDLQVGDAVGVAVYMYRRARTPAVGRLAVTVSSGGSF